jgi:ABC-2 type transport system permease protein
MEEHKMLHLTDMIWIEFRKAVRSKVPFWTTIGSLFLPLAIGFLIFVARNPELSKKLGLISVKADLMAYSATDWASYLGLTAMIIASGGFFLFVLASSWTFGREFADGTVKDLLAVPVPRASILMGKFILVTIWSITITLAISAVSLLMGIWLKLPGGSSEVILKGIGILAVTAGLSILIAFPFAWVASIGRGYLLPLGLVVLTLMMSNFVAMTGRGEFFPWSIPGLYAQGKSNITLISFVIVVLTGLVGMVVTHLWWLKTDQNK